MRLAILPSLLAFIGITLNFSKELLGLSDQLHKLLVSQFLDWPIGRFILTPLWQNGHDQPQVLQAGSAVEPSCCSRS
jgi:hypothetical protein